MKYTLKKSSTLLEAVMEIYKGISKQKAKQILGHSDFLLDGKKIKRHAMLKIEAGKVLEIIHHEKNRIQNRIPDKRTPVAIYYEDLYFVIAMKPAGILSCGHKDLPVNNSYHKVLESYLSDRDEKKVRLWVVHRLDREVEGLILFARSEKFQARIKEMWPQVTKKYLALTENKPEPPSGIIENWLIDTSMQKVIASEEQVEGSKFAYSEYKYIKKVKNYHLIEIQLHTGRKNQIRVHMAGINCPIVGDRKYGADASVVRQVRLASCSIEFVHPFTQKQVSVKYSPPARFFNPSQKNDEKYKIL